MRSGPWLDPTDRYSPQTPNATFGTHLLMLTLPVRFAVCQDLGMGRSGDERAQQDLDDLMVALRKCMELVPVLQGLLPVQPGYGPRGGTIGRHAPESKEPWHPEAANALWLMWFGSKVLADRMRVSLGLGAAKWNNGEHGLEVISVCAPAVDVAMLREARLTVERWRNTALQIKDIDEADRWTPIPRDPDQAPAVCPYCMTMSLRLNRARGEVRCMFPGCVDSTGEPTRAHMQYAPDGAGFLVFGDDRAVSFRVTANS